MKDGPWNYQQAPGTERDPVARRVPEADPVSEVVSEVAYLVVIGCGVFMMWWMVHTERALRSIATSLEKLSQPKVTVSR